MPEMELSHPNYRGLDLAVLSGSQNNLTMPENKAYTATSVSERRTRPGSTPSSQQRSQYNGPLQVQSKITRPKTAAAVLGHRECERVLQLEHEPTRRHNLKNHLPIRHSKPPPWQKNMEPLVPFVVGPGYILSRSKTKYAVTIKDEFFDAVLNEEQKKKQTDSDRDSLTSHLQQQISDLSLFLEEERLNHKQTKIRAEENLRERLEQAFAEHQEHIQELESDHQEALLQQKAEHDAEFNQYKTSTEVQIHRYVKEIEFLQGAFESYKSSLLQEMDGKWKKKEDDLKRQLEEEKQTATHEMKTKFIQERSSERSATGKEHHRQIEALRKEHKKELDALIRRFSSAAADLERLQRATAELEETKAELQQIRERYDETCQQLTNTTRNLTDTKVRLMEFEERFQEKVAAVDDKYRLKLQEMMTQNTELKRLYVRKCDQLFDEKAASERKLMEDVKTAKTTMESLLRSKHKANVSLALAPESSTPRTRTAKVRPSSAPGTKFETEAAHWSAGETDHLSKSDEYIRPDIVVPPEDPETERIRQEFMATDVRKITKEDLINTFDV